MARLVPPAAILLLIPLSAIHAGELPRAEPEAVGLSADKLAELKPALQKLVDDGKIAGRRRPDRPPRQGRVRRRRSATATWRARRP